MKKPILVIMAAGLGSRYNGLKQITPVDSQGHILIDYAIYDARRAGFEKVVCVIKPELEEEFRQVIGDRVARHVDLQFAYQTMDDLPQGYRVPQGRTKPWGTAHAALAARKLVDAPFAVINADDYYGASSFSSIYGFLSTQADATHHAMVGYRVENTLTENGSVSRGVCVTDDENRLVEVVERTRIEARPGGAAYTEDGETYRFLPAGTIVSLNMWGFGLEMMGEIERRFPLFLEEHLPGNPLKCEYYLPLVPNLVLKEGAAEIKVLPTGDKWYGVTYSNDMPVVRAALEEMKREGNYPPHLWE